MAKEKCQIIYFRYFSHCLCGEKIWKISRLIENENLVAKNVWTEHKILTLNENKQSFSMLSVEPRNEDKHEKISMLISNSKSWRVIFSEFRIQLNDDNDDESEESW